MKVSRINTETVQPIKIKQSEESKLPVLGAALFPEIYANIGVLAPKMSGKTSTIAYILNRCCDDKTQIYAFVSTLYKDANWIAISKKWGSQFHGYQSIKDGKTDVLKDILDELSAPEVPPPKQEGGQKRIRFTPAEPMTGGAEKEKKPTYRAQEIVFIFDDLSDELKEKSFKDRLIKRNRHFLCKVIISSQYIHDWPPEVWKNLDYCLLFRNQSPDKLEIIHSNLGLTISFEQFLQLYRDATAEKYSFLWVSRDNEYRRTFSYRYEVKLQ